MLTARLAGRRLAGVGALGLVATALLAAVPAAGAVLPPLVVLVLLLAGAIALLAAVVGWVPLGLLVASGTQGSPGLAGTASWGRLACVVLGLGPIVSGALAAVDAASSESPGDVPLEAMWNVCLTVLAVLAAAAVARSGALRGVARWALALPAAVQAAATVARLLPPPVDPVVSTALVGVVLPVVLILVGVAWVRDADQHPRSEADPLVRSRLGRTDAEWETAVPTSVVVARLRGALTSRRRFTLVRLDETAAGAEAEVSARPSWAAWGGRIHLRLDALGEGRTRVRGRWSPALVTAVLTWDQGERDLHALARVLAGDPAPQGEALVATAD
ncbi:hypothetical protein GCM10025783_16630 [Amnibacterium soli]|uniref:Uncharacterized protein n=1 Tax=Amnibacterium soli TaxID=1282736 RepID=A0ABP8Z432_9MICO